MTAAPGAMLCGGLWAGEPPEPVFAGATVQRLGTAVLAAPWHAADDRYLVGIAGQPHWPEPALARLAAGAGHGEALREAVNRLGADYPAALRGRFVTLVMDTHTHTLMAAVDRLGQETLYWTRTAHGLLCARQLGVLCRQPGVPTTLSPQGIFHYAYFHMLPAPSTLFHGIHRLQAGHGLHHQNDTTTVTPYWVADLQEPPPATVADLQEALLETVSRATARACGEEPAVGAFLSGGLDSSTVAGMLARHRPGQAPTFSIGFDVAGYDEMAYARAAARHFATSLHEYYVTPTDVVEAVPEIATFMDEPFGNSSALPALYCARQARVAGIGRLLAGDGGDELFAGNTRYAKQQIFEFYGRLPTPVRGVLEPLSAHLPSATPFRKLRSYIEQARIPLPDRLQSYNFLHRFGLETVFEPAFLATVDTELPLALQRELYQRPQGSVSTLNRMLYQDWQQTLADNDLRKVVGMCDLAGIEVAFPLLDDEVVALSTRVPSSLKIRGNRLRYFFREALREFLPDEVLAKSKHGFGLPFGVWMRDHPPLQALAYDSLSDLSRRGYFRTAFLEDLVHRHRHEHAAYYGEALWILMMLELWLQHHGHAT